MSAPVISRPRGSLSLKAAMAMPSSVAANVSRRHAPHSGGSSRLLNRMLTALPPASTAPVKKETSTKSLAAECHGKTIRPRHGLTSRASNKDSCRLCTTFRSLRRGLLPGGVSTFPQNGLASVPSARIPELDSANLATDGFWQFVDELDLSRVFVGSRHRFDVVLDLSSQLI